MYAKDGWETISPSVLQPIIMDLADQILLSDVEDDDNNTERDDLEDEYDDDYDASQFTPDMDYFLDPKTKKEYYKGDQLVFKVTSNYVTGEKDFFCDTFQGAMTVFGIPVFIGTQSLYATNLVRSNFTEARKKWAATTIIEAWKRKKTLEKIKRNIAARVIQKHCIHWMYMPGGGMFSQAQKHFYHLANKTTT